MDIREINERIQQESAFVDLVTMELSKVIVGQKEVEKKLLLTGQIVPHEGHTVFEFNLDTHKITVAEFEPIDINYTGTKPNRRIIQKDKCMYASALNMKNAKKKFVHQLRLIMLTIHKNVG